jgi:hypothetical protein
MTYLIGTDEAGYGPNLGPLVISASVWQVPEGVRADDLYRILDGVVCAAASRSGGTSPARMVIADSKLLYQSGKGLSALERGVLVALALLGHQPASWRDVWGALAPDSSDARRAVPWYAEYDAPVPLEAVRGAIQPLAESVEQGLDAAGVRLVGLCSRAIFAAEFNELVDRYGSKGTLLSHATLELAARSLMPLSCGPISVLCDKHGGRNAYRQLLAEWFPEWLIEVYGEGREESLYRFGPAERRVEFRFRAKGETCLATALASMASKYLRELAMRAFNAFWCDRLPGLAPTAGYPVDAKRFKAAIATVQAGLGIDDRLLWRSR